MCQEFTGPLPQVIFREPFSHKNAEERRKRTGICRHRHSGNDKRTGDEKILCQCHQLAVKEKYTINIIMVKHIILWTLKDSLSEEEKIQIKKSIKEGLESLQGVVPGLTDIKVQIDGRLASSNADLMLDCTLESEEALKGYAVHPAHVAIANSRVRPFTAIRSCLDFTI